MSRLDELLRELCSDGVEFRKVSDLTMVLRGKRLTKSQLADDGRFPVFHGGLEALGRYSESNREADTVMIINVGASAGTVGYSKERFWSSDGCFCLSHTDVAEARYLYFIFKTKEPYLISKVRKAGIPTLDSGVIENMRIPVPPLPVQREIVRILDNFTELMAELTAELTARKKQYEYYCYKLMNFDGEIDCCRLGDCCTLNKGSTPIQKAVPGKYPLVVTTTERKTSNMYQFDASAVCIPLVSSRGHGIASLNQVYYQDGKFALGNILCCVIPKDKKLSAKFLFYYLNYKKDTLIVPLMKGGANVSLTVDSLARIKVPVPPIHTQNNIVRILDKFEELTKSTVCGLPAEIEARQKQYEYYRDKLLTFKEKDWRM